MKKIPLMFFCFMLLMAAAPLVAENSWGGFEDNPNREPYVYEGERHPLPWPLARAAEIPVITKIKEFAPVALVGMITRPLGHDKFDFVDNSGHVTLQIHPDRWRGFTFGPNDIVVVEGKIDDLTDPREIEVDSINTRNHFYATARPAPGGPLPMGVVSTQFAKTMPNTAALALEGKILEKTGPGKLLFEDHTGTIILSVNDAPPLVAGPYQPGDVVVVEGRVDRSVDPPEVDAEIIVDRSNYAVVVNPAEEVVVITPTEEAVITNGPSEDIIMTDR